MLLLLACGVGVVIVWTLIADQTKRAGRPDTRVQDAIPERCSGERHLPGYHFDIAAEVTARPALPFDPPNEFVMEYGDIDGVVTTRQIRILSVGGNGKSYYVEAFCRLRNARRTFRADRVLSLRRHDGADIIAAPMVYLLEMLPEVERPDPGHDSVMGRVRPGLDVLIWIARADREISTDEQEVLFAFIAARNGLAGARFADVAWSRPKAAAYIAGARPMLDGCAAAILKMSRTGREAGLLREYADKVAQAGEPKAARRRDQIIGLLDA